MPAPLTYRQDTITKPATSTTKNSPLTNVEIDGNWHSIQDAVTAIEENNWVTTTRIGDSQVTPAKLTDDYNTFKTKIHNHTTSTGSTIIASGTTAQRDSSPIEGYFRYNITLGKPEWRNATSWITASATSDTVYIGTTAIALNRGSSSMALTGITSIDGNAATVTNGVYTTGNQTIIGDKTFSGSTNFSGTVSLSGAMSSTTTISTSGSMSANAFVGSGSGLTSLNATNLSSGTVGADRLPYATSTNKGAVRVSVSGTTLNIWTS